MNALQTEVSEALLSQFPANARLLVGLSGGPDSVALTHLLKALPFEIHVGHIDHGLRRGSRADARFVAALARQWDLPCYVKRVPVRRFAQAHGLGLEEAGRTLRYQELLAMA